MQLVLNLLSSVSIKRKKPWPKLSWIGKEQDGLYLLDGKRISQLHIPSGKTKKKISKLHGLMNDVCALNVSQNGQFLCGALCDGKVFLWERDNDKVQFVTGLPKVFNDTDKGNTKNRIFFSPCGSMMLLMMGFEKILLWQKIETDNSDDSHNVIGTWSQVHHGEYSLPDPLNKEATVDGVFYSDEVVGRCGAFSFVFNKGTELAVTTLLVESRDDVTVSNLTHNIPNQDEETTSREVVDNVKCSVKWKSSTRPLYGLTQATRLVKGRFVYVCRYSPDGQMLAIVLNQKLAKNTRLLFCSTLHSTSCVVDMKCCGGSDQSSGRAWWVSELAWTQDSLLLIGITRNGALFITTKLGEPIKLITAGYGMDLGPNFFLSLHPRITVKSFQENIPPDNSEMSSGSEKDYFQQKFSVAVHSSEPLLLCSDGYMVTIFQFNSKPDYSQVITDLTKDVSRFLLSDPSSELEKTCGNVSVQGMSAVSPFMAKLGKDVHSSPGSTLSETATGFGIARDIEAGFISFGEVEDKCSSLKVEEMNDKQRLLKAEYVLLQALGIGTSCGQHWSQNMRVAMNLLIHTWAKLFTVLLDDESNCGLSDNDALFHNIITFVQSCFEAFRWDIVYQHCLPWFTQFVHSTVKCLVSSKKFGFRETIDVCMKLQRMAELFLHEVYAWSAVSNCNTVHLLGDNFSSSYDTRVVTRNDLNSADQPREEDPAKYVNLDCKLDQSWLTLYHYVCKMYKSNLKAMSREKHGSDKELVGAFCLIQRKLQTMNTSRNLITGSKMESLSDQGYKMYLDGNYSQAADLFQKSLLENDRHPSATETKVPSHLLQLNVPATSTRPGVSRFGASLLENDLSSKLSSDIDTLLSILYINLENYDLKAALALVYSFINTACGVSLQELLETSHEQNQTLIPVDDSEIKISSSSSLKVLQLSVLVKYPLAWVIDNRAMLVVQQLARFMARYFTNLALTIPTPFHPEASASLLEESSTDSMSKASAMKHLSQRRVTEVIGQQKLESLWTADHTMELLLISGHIGEAAWFANCLGDWKIAFLLSVTEEFRRKKQSHDENKSLDCVDLAIDVPKPDQLVKERINIILKLDGSIMETDVEGAREVFDDEHISSLRTVLEASLVAELNLVPGIIKQLVDMLRESISKLDWMVPQDLYLPAPPLYCPQPARNDGDVLSEETQKEISLRTEISTVVQKILVIYRASNCFLYCAQQYCEHIVKSVRDSQAVPNVINEFITTEGVHIGEDDDDDSGVTRSFKEFCSLMWLLDVRNELALASRRYSKLKQNLSLVPNDEQRQEVINQCEEVLLWLQRVLPFSDFLNATDDVLDGILTILSELPLNGETVDRLAQYFHTPPSSLSIPTSEKLNRMTRKVRNKAEGLENSESLTIRFQQQCEKRRKEVKNISTKSYGNTFFEIIPEFCKTLEYQHDFAFLRFLDTFLLITLAKNITSEDYKKTPLILPYKDKPTLEVEIAAVAETPKTNRKLSTKSNSGIYRSRSFQDVGNIRKKPGSHLLSPDNLESDKDTPLYRSNSLTDLRRVKSSTLSAELQAFLPILLWLKRWCLIEECQKGNQGVNKSYSFLNATVTPTAIRVRLPLKLLVNTLWLMENYYKDFALAKGKCVRDKRSLLKKKRSPAKRNESGKIGDVLVEEVEHKANGKPLPQTAIGEGNRNADEHGVVELQNVENGKKVDDEVVQEDETLDEVEGIVRLNALQDVENKRQVRAESGFEHINATKSDGEKRRRKKRGTNASKSRLQKEIILESKAKELTARGGLETEEKGEAEVGRNEEIVATRRSVDNGTTLPKHRVRKHKEKNVFPSLVQKGERGLRSENVDDTCVENQTFLDEQINESEGSIINPRGVDYEKFANTDYPLVIAPILSQTNDERQVWDREKGSFENDLSRSRIKKTILPSPTSSSMGSNWKSLESVQTDIPLFTFTHADGSKKISGEESTYRVAKSEISEVGMLGIYPRHFNDDVSSQSSESLSVGQIRGDVAVQMKVAASVNSDTSVPSKKKDEQMKYRKGAKTRAHDDSSSCESLEKPRRKPVDEGSLLRRIIRSEMRKFIKAQQAEIRSHSSTIQTTDGNLSDDLNKDKVEKRKVVKNQVKTKSRHDPSMSGGNSRNKRRKDLVYRSSRAPEPQVSSLSDQGPSVNDDDRSSCYEHRRRVHIPETTAEVHHTHSPRAIAEAHRTHIPRTTAEGHHTHIPRTTAEGHHTHIPRTSAEGHHTHIPETTAEGQHDTVQNPPPQIYPPFLNEFQFPTVSGWPMWYNPTFPLPPQWVMSNSAPKVSSDKGTQMEDVEKDTIAENNPERISVVHTPMSEKVDNDSKNKIISVAVQTVSYEEGETSAKKELDPEKLSESKEPPLMVSLEDHVDARSEHPTRDVLSDEEHAPKMSCDVFPGNVSTRNDVKNPELDNVHKADNLFPIPLLKFPTGDQSVPMQSLPFRIAWPEHTEAESTEQVELPLLQLDDKVEQPGEFLPPLLPLTGNFNNAPLLHFSGQYKDEADLSDFHFVQVPENEDFQLPLLYLPEAELELPEFHSEFESRRGEDAKSEKPRRKCDGNSKNENEVGEASKARLKRRNQLAGNTSLRDTTVKPNQYRQSISKQTSSDSPSSEQEEQPGSRITVQPAEKVAQGKNTNKRGKDLSKKTKPRRDKLKELNNIIRDLQRDVTNDDDLLVSEVSSILSPEIRYENFEAKPETRSTRRWPTVSTTVNEKRERHIDNNNDVDQTLLSRQHKPTISDHNVDNEIQSHQMAKKHSGHYNEHDHQKPTPVPRLYKPSMVSARDVHTEMPSDVSGKSIPVDAKVGTENILRFPVSIQTDPLLPPQDTLNNQYSKPQPSEPRVPNVQTRELSVQTMELNVETGIVSRNIPTKSDTRDAAMNTGHFVEKREDKGDEFAKSLYPRVPADVYLDVQDIGQKSAAPSSSKDPSVNDVEQQNGERFLSVVDIAKDDVRRRIEDSNETVHGGRHREYKDIPFDEDLANMENGGRALLRRSEEMLPDDCETGDHTTLAVLSSKDIQRSSLNETSPRGTTKQHAQKISKEKLSRRLHEMNEQFDAIEALTTNMEQDIQRSNRLLRTIENLNKIADHKSEVGKRTKSVDPYAGQSHNAGITERAEQLSDAVGIQHGGANEKISIDKSSVLKSRPWINKPIEQLTDFVADGPTEERSLDSLEMGQDEKSATNDCENMSEDSAKNRPNSAPSLRSGVDETKDISDAETYIDAEGIRSRMNSVSHGTTRTHGEPENVVDPERPGGRLKLSLTPEELLNVSREKLKDILSGTRALITNTRSRDKTPQKQQDLREWMSRKRKLRHKEWTEQLNEKRESEYKPFRSETQKEQTPMSSKKLKKSEKEREDSRRTQKKENVDERLMSAYDLINEMVTDHAPRGPALITQNSLRNSQRKAAKKTGLVKANNRYKENRVVNNRKKKSTGKPSLKAPTELFSTRTIPGQIALTGSGDPMYSGRKESSDAPVYDYDVEESARQFITRKSYEKYQQKMLRSFDFDRSTSLQRDNPFQRSLDMRVDELLEDVSLGDPLDLQRIDHLDSLLSGDSELRDLLGDVISDKPNHNLLETRDELLLGCTGSPKNVGGEWRVPIAVENKGKSLDRKENNRVKDSYERYPDILGNGDDNLEMSDDIAALLAEAKAAVGDDFSGTSEVGDIDWNEVDEVLQQHN